MSRVTVYFALMLLLVATASADMKAKSRMTVAGRSMESSDYVKGARKRSEMQIAPGFNTITIYQCDLKRLVTLNERNKTYMITELGESDSGAATETPEPAPSKSTKAAAPKGPGGVITLTMNSTDTGEKKQMFGYTARHVKTQMSSDASPGSSCGANMKMETDGWYIDFQGQQLNCTMNPRATAARGNAGGGRECNDQIRIKHSGNARLGYPVSTTMTMESNGQPMTMKQETIDLSTATLDPALFEIPPGYRQVTSYSELMGMGGIGGMMAAAKAAAASSGNSGSGYNSLGSGGSTSASQTKGAGVLRIGVLHFKNSANAAVPDTLREGLVSEIQQLQYEAVPLDVSPSAKREEIEQAAKAADCDYYVISDIAKVKDESSSAAGKKAFGGFLSHVTGTDVSSGSSNNGGYSLTVDYKLYALGDKDAHLQTSSTSNAGANAEASAPPVLEDEALNVGVQVRRDLELRRREQSDTK